MFAEETVPVSLSISPLVVYPEVEGVRIVKHSYRGEREEEEEGGGFVVVGLVDDVRDREMVVEEGEGLELSQAGEGDG